MRPSLYKLSRLRRKRSIGRNKEIGVKILLVFLALYFSVIALLLSLKAEELILKFVPSDPFMIVVYRLVLSYMVFMLIIRLMMQNLPILSIQPLLILPIKKSRLAKHLISNSFFHFFNILPLFFLVPFTLRTVVKFYANEQLVLWCITFICLIIINHLLAIYLKWKTIKNEKLLIALIAIFLLLFAIDYYELIPISQNFSLFIESIVQNKWPIIILFILIFSLSILNYQYLLKNFYLVNFETKRSERKNLHNYDWVDKLTKHSELLSMEFKMIFRNKRSKNTQIVSLFFLGYGFFIYQLGQEIKVEKMFLMGILITGITIINYGQFFPAWQGNNYSFLMTQNFKFRDYLQAIYRFMVGTVVVLLILSLGYMFIDPRIGYMHLLAAIYNVGVNTYLILFFGLNNRKAISLNSSIMFNYQGTSISQFLIIIPVLLIPFGLFALISSLINSTTAIIFLTVLGLLGILLHHYILNYIEKRYLKSKYRMLAGYRKSKS